LTPTLTATVTVTPTVTPTPTCQVQAWPNPFNPGFAVLGRFKVDCLPSGALVSFYTLSGELVRSLPEAATRVEWDGRNSLDVPAAPGLYYYVVESGGKALQRGKFILMR
jgi:hypothetical protein